MTVKRKCTSCKIEKEATNEFFHRDKNRYLGLMYRCKECDKNRNDPRLWKDRWANFTDEQKQQHYKIAKIYAQTPAGRAISLCAAYQKIDKIKGFKNDITKKEILEVRENGICYYCGFPATGFDRIDNALGHTIDNCLPCCSECNTARMDNFTVDEMRIIGKAIKTIKEKRALHKKNIFIPGETYVDLT